MTRVAKLGFAAAALALLGVGAHSFSEWSSQGEDKYHAAVKEHNNHPSFRYAQEERIYSSDQTSDASPHARQHLAGLGKAQTAIEQAKQQAPKYN